MLAVAISTQMRDRDDCIAEPLWCGHAMCSCIVTEEVLFHIVEHQVRIGIGQLASGLVPSK